MGDDAPKSGADELAEMRKKIPFDLVGRGVAGVDELKEHLDDNEVYFGLLQIAIGSGSFQRSKNIFIHFNGICTHVTHNFCFFCFAFLFELRKIAIHEYSTLVIQNTKHKR